MSKIEIEDKKYDMLLEDLRRYFTEELDEELGELPAKLLLDFILEKIGPVIYNQAVSEMQKFLYEKIDDLYEYER